VADDKPWVIPADIPAEPTKKVIVIGPHHREEITDPETVAAFEKLMVCTRPATFDELHPTGRCTCGGEGLCAWCQEICERCMGDCYEYPCNACNSTGLKDGGVDYEALGYPETEFRYTPHAFETLVDQVESWWR
jgi:hypothetical protein